MEEVIATAGGGQSFDPHRAGGPFNATCIDLIDYGLMDMKWQGVTKKKHRVVLRFWAGEYMEMEGENVPHWIDAWFTLSLHENSTLRPFLESWRGQAFTDEECEGFNVAVLVGVDALIQVIHTEDGKYANINSIMRGAKGSGAGVPKGYVRVKDRPTEEQPETVQPGITKEDEDDGLPF